MTLGYAFPFACTLSLEPLLAFWEEHAAAGDPMAPVARHVREVVASHPELRAPVADVEVLARHDELLPLLMSAVVPPAPDAGHLAAAIVPFHARAFFQTRAFARWGLLGANRGVAPPTLASMPDDGSRPCGLDVLRHGRIMHAFYLILQQHYGVKDTFEFPLVVETSHPETGLTHFFAMEFDTRFIRVRLDGERPPISEDDLSHLRRHPLDYDEWARLLPPDRFTFEGFGLLHAHDVTFQEVISALKNGLLQRDAFLTAERMEALQEHLRALLRRPDLRLGLIGLPEGTAGLDALNTAQAIGRSLLFTDQFAPTCPERSRSFYAQAFEARTPVVVEDLQHQDVCTGFEQHLMEQNLRNLVVAPLRVQDRLVGLLELASPHPGDLTALNVVKLSEVMALFATAMRRSLDEQEDRLQAVIKSQCTAIHPVVEWRFRQAALRFLLRRARDTRVQMEPIAFTDVYPLYGLSDIRGSSEQRNLAIQADLTDQLSLAFAVIVEATAHRPLPILDELGYRVNAWIDRVHDGLGSGDESEVHEFLQEDVQPLFPQLRAFGSSVTDRIDAYEAAIDPDLGFLYQRRKDFERSVMRINDALATYLDEQETHAQRMFPHYFAKYKTDGVDYNIYVGDSLVEGGGFDQLHLRNLRLWQLMTMCGMVWESEALKPSLPVPLDTAHLILVQNTPLAIRFRYDEKQFDVDGAYNIRYELVKKRIDKAEVLGRQERLTQPGHIAIVYAQDREVREYGRYIAYLQAAGYLEADVEQLELTPTQGVQGLHALRVRVAERPPESLVIVTGDGVAEAADVAAAEA